MAFFDDLAKQFNLTPTQERPEIPSLGQFFGDIAAKFLKPIPAERISPVFEPTPIQKAIKEMTPTEKWQATGRLIKGLAQVFPRSLAELTVAIPQARETFRLGVAAEPIEVPKIFKPIIGEIPLGAYAKRTEQDILAGTNPIKAVFKNSLFGTWDILIAGSILKLGTQAIVKNIKVPDITHYGAWETIGRPATQTEAKSTYRQLAHILHPDKPTGSNEAFIALNNAYKIVETQGIPKVPPKPLQIIRDIAEIVNLPISEIMKVKSAQPFLGVKGLLPGFAPAPTEPRFAPGLRIQKVTRVGGVPEIPKIVPELEPLAQEARKFKSAEEFVESQKRVFRGGEPFRAELIEERGVPVTTDRKIAERFAKIKKESEEFVALRVGREPRKYIVEENFISPTAKIATRKDVPDDIFRAYKAANPVTEPEIAEPIIGKWARANNFDAVDFSTLGKTSAKEAEIKIYNPNILKTKSQLIDFYNQAVKEVKPAISAIPKELEPLAQEARKIAARGGTVEEFVRVIEDAPPGSILDSGAERLAFKKEFRGVEDFYNQAVKGVKPIISAIPKELEPLAIEARKYKSAEEFVKSHVFEGLTKEGDLTPIKKVFFGSGREFTGDISRGAGLPTTIDPSIAKSFAKEHGGKFGIVNERFISPDARIIKIDDLPNEFRSFEGIDAIEQASNYARAKGFDALDMIKGNREAEIRVFNPKVLLTKEQTKSQLTDFYNQAVRGVKEVPEISLAQEARKIAARGGTAEEFVKEFKGIIRNMFKGKTESEIITIQNLVGDINEKVFPLAKKIENDAFNKFVQKELIQKTASEGIKEGLSPAKIKLLQEGKMQQFRDNPKVEESLRKMFSLEDSTNFHKIAENQILTDFYNQAVRGVKEIAPKVKAPVKIPTLDSLRELGKKVGELAGKSKEEIKANIGQLKEQLSFYKELDMPGKELQKFISKKEGEFLDFKDPERAKTLIEKQRIIERNKRVLRASEAAFEGTPKSNLYDDPDIIREAIEEYQKVKASIEEISAQIEELTAKRITLSKGEVAVSIGMRQRRAQYNAIQGRWDLTENEMKRFLHGRNISAMDADEWRTFVKEADEFGEATAKQRNAMTLLEGTIEGKELKKVENLQAALDLPPVHKMNTEQLVNFEKILDQYKTGDEFLPVRMLQTLSNTELAGAKTVREVLEVLSKKSGRAVEDMPIKITEFHRTLGDRRLARQHPFLEVLVERKNRGLLEAEARIIEITDEMDELIKNARKSRKRGILERFIPKDANVIRWSETLDETVREAIEKTMTKEEIVAAKRWDEIRRAYYDYLVKRHAEQKFSRFEGQYFPHVRRGFLEAWKEDGILNAFKEMRDKYRQDQFTMDILNEKTGEILPYEKWIGFAQFRSDKLIPTQNASRAIEAYVTALEKARHVDEITPEIMAYVHSLSPRNLSQHGVELDTSLKKFTKEWLNANKGRVPKGFFNPGGSFDVGNRSLIALTRVIDLGWNFTTQIAAPVGENLMTLTMLKPEAYFLAQIRARTEQAKIISTKYKNFIGRTPWEEMTRAANNIGDKFMAGAFAIYGQTTRQANRLFLLGKMTEEEFKTGIISSQRLAELQIEMSKYRKVRGLESVMGRTTEAEAVKQYKSWAIPILTATIENSYALASIIRKNGIAKALSSDAGKELFYSIGIGSAIGLYIYTKYRELKDKGAKRTFMEDIVFKAMRDAVSIYGAFDPTMWSGVRVVDFLEDMARAISDLAFLETYKTTGELKAPKEFERLLTPAILKRVLPKELLGIGEEPQKAKDILRKYGIDLTKFRANEILKKYDIK